MADPVGTPAAIRCSNLWTVGGTSHGEHIAPAG